MRVPFLTASLSRGSRRAVFFPGGAAWGLLLCLAIAACSKQRQGERCDPNNRDGDCESDLVCKGEALLTLEGQTRGVGLCCPPVANATVEACRAAQPLPPDVDAGPEPIQTPVETPAQITPTDAGSQPDAGSQAPAP